MLLKAVTHAESGMSFRLMSSVSKKGRLHWVVDSVNGKLAEGYADSLPQAETDAIDYINAIIGDLYELEYAIRSPS